MSQVITDKSRIATLLTRGVEEAISRDDLEKQLLSGERLRVKLGIDPTSPNLHLGRSIPLLKLRDFQELGHQIVFIIGDFTGVIGDTSDKDSERPMLSEREVKANLKTYIKQAAKIIDVRKAEVYFNSRWLRKLDYQELCRQADQFSLNEFISRENIAKRLSAGKSISLRELLYPLMQGYDSVRVKADVEVGGTDQRFNLLAGRTLQKHYGQAPQNIITNPLIEGLDGRKMSSSWGNTVNLADAPNDMFGKIMSLKDEFIIRYFELVTRADLAQIKAYKADLASGKNPRDYKLKLAYEIVRFYHSDRDADLARDYFIKTISHKETPDERPRFKPAHYDILSVLVESGTVSSKSDGRRVLAQNGVKVNKEVVSDPERLLQSGDVIQKGKTTFLELI